VTAGSLLSWKTAALPLALLCGGCLSASTKPWPTAERLDLPSSPTVVDASLADTNHEGPHDAPAKKRAPSPGRRRIVDDTIEGRPIPYHVVGSGSETVMLLATIHGNEAAGTPVLERLLSQVAAEPTLLRGRRLVVVPVVNPDGLAANRRRNARGVDLNRNFPSDNRQDGGDRGSALSEPETQALHQLITEFEPMVVVSVHGWLGLIDWDGPAESLAAEMGALCQLPAQRLGSRPGSLGSFVGVDRQVPIITFELPSSARRASDDELWERYGPALLATLSWSP